MSERLPLPDKDWRELSARISPEIEAGFDLAGLADLLSTKQRGMLALPKRFRVHKVQHNRQLLLTSDGLGLYGELDRAVAGLLPLRQIPVEEHLIADYAVLNAAIDTVYFYCLRAGRQDLVQALQPLQDISVQLYTIPEYNREGRFTQLLDLTEEELHDRSHWTARMWLAGYIQAAGLLAKARLLGGSSRFSQEWLLRQIDRYAEKVFSTPGYEPFNDHPWPTGQCRTRRCDAGSVRLR